MTHIQRMKAQRALGSGKVQAGYCSVQTLVQFGVQINTLLARKRHKPLEVAFIAAYPQESVFEAAALQVGLEFPVDMVWDGWLNNATSKEAAEPGAIHQMRR